MSQPSRGDAVELARLQAMQDAIAPGIFQYQRFITEAVIVIGGWAAVTLEVFSRYRFGERYLTPFRLSLGGVIYGIFALLFGGLNVASFLVVFSARSAAPGEALVLLLFFVLFVLAGFVHSFEIFYRNNYSDLVWHSASFGVAWPFRRVVGRTFGPLPPVDEWFVYRYAEPWAWFMVGGFFTFVSTFGLPLFFLGLWLMIAASALFAKNQAIYRRERDQELNLIDAEIENAARQPSARGVTIEHTGGFKAITLPRAVDANQDGTPEALAYDEDEQAIMRRTLRSFGGQNSSPALVAQAAPAVTPTPDEDEEAMMRRTLRQPGGGDAGRNQP